MEKLQKLAKQMLNIEGVTVDQVKAALMAEALRRTDGNRSQAARVLGVSICTVRNWIIEYQLLEQFPPSMDPRKPAGGPGA